MIYIKNNEDIQNMKLAGKIVGDTLKLLQDSVKVGVSTMQLNKIAEDYIRKNKAIPSFLGYGGFPASVCISIDEEVVHGIPKKHRLIEEGMIVSFDVGAIINGWHGDAARTVCVGNVDAEKARLVKVTEESFFKGIEQFKEGNRLGDISHAIQKHAEDNGFSVVRDLVGHGIGREMHEDPQVENFGKAGRGIRLQPGMALAIEPMINMGTFKVDFSEEDGWTVTTRDKLPSSHYENTTVLTENGVEILTL